LARRASANPAPPSVDHRQPKRVRVPTDCRCPQHRPRRLSQNQGTRSRSRVLCVAVTGLAKRESPTVQRGTLVLRPANRVARSGKHTLPQIGCLGQGPPAERATPTSHLIDRNVLDPVPASAVGAFDPDARLPLQRAPLWLVLLPETEFGRCDLDLSCCRPDVEDFVVTSGHVLTEPFGDSKPCHTSAQRTDDPL
jgi:hypothetical protein